MLEKIFKTIGLGVLWIIAISLMTFYRFVLNLSNSYKIRAHFSGITYFPLDFM